MAIRFGVKYIETSPGINHNVDELLVGMLAQIQLRQQVNKAYTSHVTVSHRSLLQAAADEAQGKFNMGTKVKGFLDRVMNMHQGNKTKSCGNLHVL